MKKIYLVALLSLFIFGCTEKKISTTMKTFSVGVNGKKIAIVPFENLTPNTRAGEDFAKYCYNSLFKQLYGVHEGKLGATEFQLMDPQQLKVIMEKEKWIDQKSYVDVGMEAFLEKIGCDLILLGTVSEFHYKKGLGEDPVASLHLRLYQRQSKTVIWSGTHSKVGRFSWFKEDSLGRLAQEVSDELMQMFCEDVIQTDTSS